MENQDLAAAIEARCLRLVREAVARGGDVNAMVEKRLPLNCAAHNGDLPIVEFLIASGADVAAADKSAYQPQPALHAAAVNGSVAILSCLLDHGADMNARGKDPATVLHTAAKNGHAAAIEFLLLNGALPFLEDAVEYFPPPLHLAAASGSIDAVDMLLKYGANIHLQCMSGRSVFLDAASIQMVEFLQCKGGVLPESKDQLFEQALTKKNLHLAEHYLKLGMDPSSQFLKSTLAHNSQCLPTTIVEMLLAHGVRLDRDSTALHKACGNYSDRTVATVRLLLRHGANVHALNHARVPLNKETPLHVATAHLCHASVQLLLEAGADVNAADKRGETAIYRAVWREDYALVQLLLEHGANVNSVTNNGISLLHASFHAEITELLLSYGADVHAVTNAGDSVFHIASSPCCKTDQSLTCDNARVLVAYGADVTVLNEKRHSTIATLSRSAHGRARLVTYLVENGATVSTQSEHEPPMLHYFVRNASEFETMVDTVLAAGGDLDAVDYYDRRTALHQAAANVACNAVQLLLQRGVAVNAMNVYGRTPLAEVIKAAHNENFTGAYKVARLLCEAGGVLPRLDDLSGAESEDDEDDGTDINYSEWLKSIVSMADELDACVQHWLRQRSLGVPLVDIDLEIIDEGVDAINSFVAGH